MLLTGPGGDLGLFWVHCCDFVPFFASDMIRLDSVLLSLSLAFPCAMPFGVQPDLDLSVTCDSPGRLDSWTPLVFWTACVCLTHSVASALAHRVFTSCLHRVFAPASLSLECVSLLRLDV